MLDPEEMSIDQLIEEVMYWRGVHEDAQEDFMSVKLADLTVAEAKISMALWEARGRIVSRDFIQDRFLPPNSAIDERTVDSHIKRLRKKLRKLGWPGEIKTSYGRGYYMERDAPHPADRSETYDDDSRPDTSDTGSPRQNVIRSQMAQRRDAGTCNCGC